MMNQRDFNIFCRSYEDHFKRWNMGCSSKSNSNETLTHYLRKSEVWFKLKHKIPSELLDEGKTPKWYEPHVFTEVVINDNVFDVVALTLSGAFIFEVAKSEKEESLKEKEAAAKELHYNFERVYC
jgi:hypothetical protein